MTATHLAPREMRMLALLCDSGKSNKQIASDLGVTVGTVKVYFNRMSIKLGRMNRVGMALWWDRLHRAESGA